jgi:phospholipid:diacylglycerol acyltransferase
VPPIFDLILNENSHNLEVRDAFFTRLRDRIEQNKRITGRKTVLISHSMGGSVVNFFLKWVEAADNAEGFRCGNRGDQWVNDFIEAHVGIASTLLGVTKSMTAFLSGEMKDTYVSVERKWKRPVMLTTLPTWMC